MAGRQDVPDAQNGNLGNAFVDDVIHSHHRLEAEAEYKSVAFESLDKATQTEEVIHSLGLALPVSMVDSSTSTAQDYDEYVTQL